MLKEFLKVGDIQGEAQKASLGKWRKAKEFKQKEQKYSKSETWNSWHSSCVTLGKVFNLFMLQCIQWRLKYYLSHMVLVKINWFSVYTELLEECQARVNTVKEVEILLLLLNGVPVAIVVWMWEYSWTGAMCSRWQEGDNKREAFEAKRDDGRQPVMPCDDDVYTSGDDKVKSLSRVWLFATPWTIAYLLQ